MLLAAVATSIVYLQLLLSFTSCVDADTKRTYLSIEEVRSHLQTEKQVLIAYGSESSCNNWSSVVRDALDELLEEDTPFFCSTDESVKAEYGDDANDGLVLFKSQEPFLFSSADASHPNVGTLAQWLSAALRAKLHVLNQQNFEHLTQAASGATTGDWLVFFASSSECPGRPALLGAAAVALHGATNVALLDTDLAPKLTARLSLKSCQNYVLFRHGRMYEYVLRAVSARNLLGFATNWYKDAPSSKVPPEPTPFDELTDSVVAWLKSQTSPSSGSQSLLLVLGGPVFTIAVILTFVFCCIKAPKEKSS